MSKDNIITKWNLLKLKCEICGEDMEVKVEQRGCFYGCMAYPKCYNRMNAEVYDKIIDGIQKALSESFVTNLTNYKWRYKTAYQHYEFKVEKELPGRYVIAVLNVKKGKTLY